MNDKQYYEDQAELVTRKFTHVQLEDAIYTISEIKQIIKDFESIPWRFKKSEDQDKAWNMIKDKIKSCKIESYNNDLQI